MPQAISLDRSPGNDTKHFRHNSCSYACETNMALHLCCISSQVSRSLFLINNERRSSHSQSCEQRLASCSLDSSSQHAFIELSELAVASRMYQLRNVVTSKLWVPARPQSSAHDPRACSPRTVDQTRQNLIPHMCCQTRRFL